MQNTMKNVRPNTTLGMTSYTSRPSNQPEAHFKVKLNETESSQKNISLNQNKT